MQTFILQDFYFLLYIYIFHLKNGDVYKRQALWNTTEAKGKLSLTNAIRFIIVLCKYYYRLLEGNYKLWHKTLLIVLFP